MTSPVNWTLLGLVIERPSYGHELFNRHQRMYMDVLPVSGESHIYTALDVLGERGLIEQIPGPAGMGRQPKPHYKATQRGIRSYEDWLAEQILEQLRQQRLWVRQLAIFAHDPPAALRTLGRFRSQCLTGAGETGRSADGPPTSPRDVIDYLVDEQQRISVGGMLDWLETANASFEDLARRAARDDPPRT
jgi:DNA-binding PadR family transcriptional regulator